MTHARLLSVCLCVCVCVAANAAATHGCWYHDAAAAMSCWNDAKVRQALTAAGLVSGHYKVTESGDRLLVEAVFCFKDRGKISYRQYHAKGKGAPGPVELVRLYRRAQRR